MKTDDTADEIEQIAQNTYGPNKQLVHAIARQVRSTGKTESHMRRFVWIQILIAVVSLTVGALAIWVAISLAS